MAGLSPGTSGSTSGSVSGETVAGAGEAYCTCWPCDRGCAPFECIVKLPKSLCFINLTVDMRDNREYGELVFIGDDSDVRQTWELSVDNLVRTISTCHEVEEVSLQHIGGGVETWKSICEALKSVSVKRLFIEFLTDIDCLVSEAIFSVLGANSMVQECTIKLNMKSSEDGILRVLVDALLHNHSLQQFYLGISFGSGGIEEVIRYMRAPTNVLAGLDAYNLSDEELVEVADALGDNKRLRSLIIQRDGSGRGVGRIGEALCTNRVLEELTVRDTEMGGEEMEALVGALVPDPTSALQPNVHLQILKFDRKSIRNKEEMEQVAVLLQSNTSLRSLGLPMVDILEKGHKDLIVAAQMLFKALQSNASLESLDLYGCSGIGGKEVLGMIMDMLLHNHSVREIDMKESGLEQDGGVEVVYAELRSRQAKEVDKKLEEVVQKMEHVSPNSARVFLCGNPEAGKTTLCDRWNEIDGKKAKRKIFRWANPFSRNEKRGQKNAEKRTRGIEVHKIIWGDMKISIWDMAGQMEYHAFHDIILPNQSAKGECCFYFIICNPMQHWSGELSLGLEAEIEYWLRFLASNTRQSESYRPHVTIVMTHRDLWPSDLTFIILLEDVVVRLKKKYQDVLHLDKDSFIDMDNSRSCDSARMIKHQVQEYLVHLSSKLPKVLKASLDVQPIVQQWCAKHVKNHVMKWEDFSKDVCEKVEALRALQTKDEDLFEKMKKHVASILHSGGHVIWFEDLELVIMNPNWFCNDVMGNILRFCKDSNEIYGGKKDYGIIHGETFSMFWKIVCQKQSFELAYKDIIMIMTKLQICFEDIHDRIMIPSLLSCKLDSMDWKVVFHESDVVYKYTGTRLTKRDNTITSLSAGFFPRLQVLLHGKYQSNTYKVYLNAISFIHEDINVIISFKDGSIDIMSRCIGERDHVNRELHKAIMRHVNDLRQTPTLGCPGVILEEHIIWPSCIEHPSKGKFQFVAKKYLKEMVLHTGNLSYVHHGEDENGLDQALLAKVLLGDEEWQMILQSREKMVIELDEEVSRRLNVVCASTKKIERLHLVGTLEGESVDEALSSIEPNEVIDRLKSIKRLIVSNHKEVMERLQEMETKIIHSQETLAARICVNIDHLMECTLQMKNSKIPKLPYITKSDGKGGIRTMLLKMVPGLDTYHLQFRCEHNDHGLHMMDDQPGCEIHIGDHKTRTFGIVMYWGLAISTMLVKVGAHMVAGAGSMVPNYMGEFATLLETTGLLDFDKPQGVVLEYLPTEAKENRSIRLEDNKVAIGWLVKLLGEKCKSRSMYEMFKLTEVKYTSKSSKGSEIGWVCDQHKY